MALTLLLLAEEIKEGLMFVLSCGLGEISHNLELQLLEYLPT
jgi:hypothetical protein